MIKIFQLLCLANFLSFGLQLEQQQHGEEETTTEEPKKLQFRQQSGKFNYAKSSLLEIFLTTSSIDMRRLFKLIYFCHVSGSRST